MCQNYLKTMRKSWSVAQIEPMWEVSHYAPSPHKFWVKYNNKMLLLLSSLLLSFHSQIQN